MIRKMWKISQVDIRYLKVEDLRFLISVFKTTEQIFAAIRHIKPVVVKRHKRNSLIKPAKTLVIMYEVLRVDRSW